MRALGSGWAEGTTLTMIGSDLCQDATGDCVAGCTELTRVGRGLYRLTVLGSLG